MQDSGSLSENEAHELWQRASELQERERQMAQSQADGSALLPSAAADGDPNAISADIARQAAIESGIDARFVDAAQLQLSADSHLDDAARREKRGGASSSGPFGIAERVINERIALPSGSAETRAAAMQILSNDTYSSELVEVIEPNDRQMALVYEIPAKMLEEGSFNYTVRQVAEVTRFAVTISKLDDDSSEIGVYARMDRSVRVNAIAMRVIQAAAGVGAGVGGFVLGTSLVAGSAGLIAGLLPAALAVLMGGGVAAGIGALFRASYRKAHGKVREAFKRVLTAVRIAVRTEEQ